MSDHDISIQKSINYINSHLNDDLSPEILAEKANYSLFHFCRMFKEVTGESVMRFVRGKRMEMANSEMEAGYSLSDIAAKCGYETTSGFSRAYKKQFGQRPEKIMRQ